MLNKPNLLPFFLLLIGLSAASNVVYGDCTPTGQSSGTKQKSVPSSADQTSSAAAPHGSVWGITITRASYYSPSGQYLGLLPGGVLMDIIRSRETSSGEMSLVMLELDGKQDGPFLISVASLVRFSNLARNEVPTDDLSTLQQYYALQGKRDQRVADLKAKVECLNPYANAYHTAVQKYKDFDQQVALLTEKRDTATSTIDLMTYADKLRQMLPEGTRLQRAVEESKSRFNKWNAENPAIANFDTSNDAQIKQLQEQIASLEPRVKEILQ